MLNYRYVVK